MRGVAVAPGSLGQAYWLAVRGAQQMDLASRFTARAEARGLRLLALKGISIAEELYGSLDRRPMFDIDLLVVDTARFKESAEVARSMGLVEIGAADHALVFKEPRSDVVLELHVSLTACPGLFPMDYFDLWERRRPVLEAGFSRLGNADLIIHLALHTAFQHGFTANEFHYGDFRLALEKFALPLPDLTTIARRSGALATLSAMALVCAARFPESASIRELASVTADACPPALARWARQWTSSPPPLNLRNLAFVRYQLAPSKWGYLRRSLLPPSIPGRTLTRPHPLRRILNVLDVARTKSKPR